MSTGLLQLQDSGSRSSQRVEAAAGIMSNGGVTNIGARSGHLLAATLMALMLLALPMSAHGGDHRACAWLQEYEMQLTMVKRFEGQAVVPPSAP
jgi:hypothetical protein